MNILKPASLLALSLFAVSHRAPAAPLDYSVSWLGNSFGGVPDWVQQDIEAMFVAPDGTVYTNVGWDEGGRNVGVYKDGRAIGDARHTHGWGYNGGQAIAVNDRYVFIAQAMDNEGGGLKGEGTWPPKGFGWLGISRRLRSGIADGAPFEGGKGGSGDTLPRSFLPVAQVPDNSKLSILGLCATQSRVYVSDPQARQVKIYDAETMALISSWPLEDQGPMLLDKAGTLWILQSQGTPRIARYSVEGKKLRPEITFAPDARPVAMCLDNRGRMLVADDGPSQQVLVLDSMSTKPLLVGTLGHKGGILSGRAGEFGDWKLNRPRAIGCDARGNIFVAHNGSSGGGSTVLESYAPNGRLNWRLLGLTYVDMADQDPGSPGDVFTKEERFRLDPTRPRGGEAAYAAFTINRLRFPQDPRLHIWSAGALVRRIGGKRFLFVQDMNAERLQVYRFEASSETAIPCALFSPRHIDDDKGQAWPPNQPERGEWLWSDANGNGAFDAGEFSSGDGDAPNSQGWSVDSEGNVWLAAEDAGIRMFPLRGLDARGVPSWGFAAPRRFDKPTELDQVKRLRYDAASDVMYLGGTLGEDKNQHWKPMGPVLCRYDGWARGARTLRWKIVAPYAKGSSGHESCEPMGFDVADGLIFVPYTGASKEIGFKTGHIEVFRAADGSSVGSMEPPSDIGEVGLQDIRECLSARRQANGDYLVFLEDDYKSKVLMFRLKPPGEAK